MYVISISYKTASLEIRKGFAFSIEEQKEFLHLALAQPSLTECVLLSTCNRMEVYFEGDEQAVFAMEECLCRAKQVSTEQTLKYFNVFQGEKAIRHLFQVAGGMDSMVLGEDEILGQVKDAYALALGENATAFSLNTIFQQAITGAKKAKTQTGLSKTPVSMGTLTANAVFDLPQEEKTVLLMGVSGKMGTIVAKNLLAKPNVKVLATLRSHKSKDSLEAKYENLTYVDYHRRYEYMNQADVVISATSSPHYTVTFEDWRNGITERRPRLFIDLAVPQDIDPRIAREEENLLYNIDYFEMLSKENNIQKQKEAENAKEVLEQSMKETLKELAFHDFLPKLPLVKGYFETHTVEQAIYQWRKHLGKEELATVLAALDFLLE